RRRRGSRRGRGSLRERRQSEHARNRNRKNQFLHCHLDSLSSIIWISAMSGSGRGFLRRPPVTVRGTDLESLCKLGSGSFRRVRRSLNRIRLVVFADEIPGYIRSRGGVNTDAGVLQTARVEEVRDAMFGAILIEGLLDLLVNVVGLRLFTFAGKLLRILE